MVPFANLLPHVLLALLFAFTTSATQWPARFHPATHRTHYLDTDRSLKLEAFHPRSTFERFGVNGVNPHPRYSRYFRSTLDTSAAAVSFLASKLSISEDSVHFRTSARGQAAHHVFLSQKIKGVLVSNAVANVAFNDNGKVTSYSSSFVKHSAAADINPSVSIDDAIVTAERTLRGTHDGHPPTLEFVVKPSGFAALAHVVQIRNKTAGRWQEAFVDAHDNTVISMTDFVSKASYLVIPFSAEDVNTQGFFEIIDPQNVNASPNGWHQEFTETTNTTDGNNVIAYTGSGLSVTAVETSPVLNFSYVTDFTQDPIIGTNPQAAMTNAFFVVNNYHDLAFMYGFTETNFNFQSNNFDKGGEEYDRIFVSVQDTEGINGADFAVLPDGQSGTMRLFLFVDFFPRRDSALQNEIIIHECQHGASSRMTGGGTARCFQTLEAAAISEGYSDAMADALFQNWNPTDYVFGKGVSINNTGLRRYPYSVSSDVNPLRYSSLNGMTDPHAMGEVWANILHNVFYQLVYAFEWTWLAWVDPTIVAGNVMFFHLFFDALLLQPCNPTFIDARDAWIQADADRYNGDHMCRLWRVFASRGLGANANADYVDDSTLPPGC